MTKHAAVDSGGGKPAAAAAKGKASEAVSRGSGAKRQADAVTCVVALPVNPEQPHGGKALANEPEVEEEDPFLDLDWSEDENEGEAAAAVATIGGVTTEAAIGSPPTKPVGDTGRPLQGTSFAATSSLDIGTGGPTKGIVAGSGADSGAGSGDRVGSGDGDDGSDGGDSEDSFQPIVHIAVKALGRPAAPLPTRLPGEHADGVICFNPLG